MDISNPDNWVDDLNPETRRYVKYLAFDEDIPDSTVYTNAAFEKAAADRGFADGGSIHIKPSHRGRLTELKARTGKSEAELYNDGNPAHRKMVVFARNARKWKHGDGGLLKNYFEDGGPERQNWFTRATMNAMLNGDPAVATAAGWTRDAEGNVVQTEQDNPGVQQLRNNLAILAGTSYAAPLMSAAPVAVNWLSNPANQILAGKFTVPMLGAGAFDEAVRKYTPYSSWGDAVVSGTGLGEVMDYALLPDSQKEFVRSGAEFTNPAFFAPYERVAKGISGLYDRGMEYIRNIRRPGLELPYEPRDAFAVDLNSGAKDKYTIEVPAEVEIEPRPMTERPSMIEPLPVAEHPVEVEPVPVSEPLSTVSFSPELTSSDFLNDRARTLLQGIDDANNRTAEILAQTRQRMARAQRRPISELSDAELSGERLNSIVLSEPSYSAAEIDAEIARREAAARNIDFSSIPIDELREMRRAMHWNDPRYRPATDNLRNRIRAEYGIGNSLDTSGMTEEQLANLIDSRDLYDINLGIDANSSDFINAFTLREQASRELRSRVQHMDIPSSFSSLDDAARMYSIIKKAGYQYSGKANDVLKAVAPDLKRAIVMGDDIPQVFQGKIDGMIEQMIDSNKINPGDRWFEDWLGRKAESFRTASSYDLKNSVNNLTGSASDASADAVDKLIRSKALKTEVVKPDGTKEYADRSLGELLDMVRNPESLPDAQREEVERIVKSAYRKPGGIDKNATRSKQIRNGLLEDEIRRRLPESIRDRFSLETIGNPDAEGYPEIARAVRDDLGFKTLPGDIEHLYWFQVKNAREAGASEFDAKTRVALQSEMLQRGMPRQTAIAESNRSPQSLLNSYKGAVRSPGGYGTEPGQTSIVELSSNLERGNALQTRRVKFDSDGKMTIGEKTEGAAENFFTRDEMQEFIDAYNASGEDIKAALESDPKFVKLTDKLIRLSRAMNNADSQPISAAVKNINRRFNEKLSEPTLSIFARTSDTPSFWSYKNMADVEQLWKRFVSDLSPSGLSGDIQGYATYLERVPTITLKHRYGGMISRYGSDNIRHAIQNVRARQKK